MTDSDFSSFTYTAIGNDNWDRWLENNNWEDGRSWNNEYPEPDNIIDYPEGIDDPEWSPVFPVEPEDPDEPDYPEEPGDPEWSPEFPEEPEDPDEPDYPEEPDYGELCDPDDPDYWECRANYNN